MFNMATNFLKLPFEFDAQLLQADLSNCQNYIWRDHFNTSDYEGEWKIIALRSISGKSQEITASSGDYKDTELMESCHYFREVIDTLQCQKESIRLMSLAPGSLIKPHRDNLLSYLEGFFRIHVPVTTEPEVMFFFDEQSVQMKAGEMWYGDFGVLHSISHGGTRPRVHLVIDCLRNEWSDQLFERSGYDFEYYKRIVHEKRIKDLPVIIANLEQMGANSNASLIADLKAELKMAGK